MANALSLLLAQTLREKAEPVGHVLQGWRWLARDELIAKARYAPANARPAPRPRRCHKPRAHGVEFDVADRGDEMLIVHRTGMESALPQMPAPAVAPVDGPGVTLVRGR